MVARHPLRFRERIRAPTEHAVGQKPALALGEEAPRVFIAHRALERHPARGPLILQVEAVVARAVPLLPGCDALRDLVGHAVVEAVLQAVQREVAEGVGDLVGRLIAHLQAVRAGDVRRRRPPHVVRLVVVPQAGKAVVVEVVQRHAGERALLDDGDERQRVQGARRRLAAPVAEELRVAGLEQQLVRRGRRPVRLRDLLAVVPHVRRLGRPRAERAHRGPVVAPAAALVAVLPECAALTRLLIVEVHADLVALRDLSGHADAGDFLVLGVAHFHGPVGHVVPQGGIGGVGVGVDAGDVLVIAERPQHAEEPRAIPLDGSADGDAGVPVLDDFRQFTDAERPQPVVEVVALRPPSGGAAEERPAEVVATRLRHEVELRSAAVGFAESAGHRDLHFL